jgi:hypothetical protein
MSDDAHLSSFELDSLALGALSPAAAERAEAHLRGCPRCAVDRDQLAAARARFAQVVLPRTRERVLGRSATPFWRRSRWWSLVPAAALAAGLLFFFGKPGARLGPGDPDILTKGGGASAAIFGQRDGGVFAVHEGERLRAGDAIRFVVAPGGLGYVIVGSADGAGHGTVYYPSDGATASAAVAPDAKSELPGAVVLDDAPGPERVFVLFSRTPLDAAAVTAALSDLARRGTAAIRATRTLPLPAAASAAPAAAVTQWSLCFEKQR